MTTFEEKLKLRELALQKINKNHGKNTVGVYSQMPTLDIETISTGSLGLDIALGVGGFGRGRIVEIYGDTGSAKTTITLHFLAEVQRSGGLVAFIDAEHALDPKYAVALGVNLDDITISQPEYGEQALDVVETLVESGVFDAIVVDSVAALVPKKELEGEMGDATMGGQARMMGQAMRKLTAIVSKTKTCLVFINQQRTKIGVTYGDGQTTTGGNALKFYSTHRLEVKRIASVKGPDNTVVAARTLVKVVKNKLAPPFKTAEFEVAFGKGINRDLEVLELAVAHGIIEKSGAWLLYKDQKWQGFDKTLEAMKSLNLFEELRQAVKARVGLR